MVLSFEPHRVYYANSGGTTTYSIVSPTGDRLEVKVGATLNWLLPVAPGSQPTRGSTRVVWTSAHQA